MQRLKELYTTKVASELMKQFKLKNKMQIPVIQKVVINSGIGSFKDNKAAMESFEAELTNITGQKIQPKPAKKSEAGFKIRKGDVVAFSTTLRGEKMWVFLDKLFSIAIPRVRDFKGLSDKAFDQNGNYCLGIKEHVIFPEVNPNTTNAIRSLQVNIVLNSKDISMNKYLLKELGLPFVKEELNG